MPSTIHDSSETAPAFDARDYVAHLRRNWRLIAIACVIAGVAALGEGLLRAPRYTSTASILIEAPAGNDSRIATSISPVYLESLRTYEVIGASDSLFLQAVQKFQLRTSNSEQTIEALKARVLKVTKLRDTKVLQIAVTLKSPKEAQAMAQFLAEETVKIAGGIAQESGADLVAEAQRQADKAKAKMDELQSLYTKTAAGQPVEGLQTELEPMIGLRYGLQRSAAEAEADAAESELRGESGEAMRGKALRARAAVAAKRAGELETQITLKSGLLAERTARLQRLMAEWKDAQKLYDAESKRAQDLRAAVGLSGERLRVIDRGGVPERPSEPRVALQTGAAIGVALLACLVYLSFTFGFRP